MSWRDNAQKVDESGDTGSSGWKSRAQAIPVTQSSPQSERHSVYDAYKTGGVGAAVSQLKDNAQQAWNYNPSQEQRDQAAKNPVTGMDDPAYSYGLGFAGPSSLGDLKGLLSVPGKLKGLLRGGGEAAQVAQEAAPVAKEVFDPFTKTSRMVGQPAAQEAEMVTKTIRDPFTKTMRTIQVPKSEGLLQASEPVVDSTMASKISDEPASLLDKYKWEAAGGAAGGYLAHKLGMPIYMGTAAGAAALPPVAKGLISAGKSVLPAIEVSGPAGNAMLRSGVGAKKLKDDYDANH